MRTFSCGGCQKKEQREAIVGQDWFLVAGFYYCANCAEKANCKARTPDQQCFCGCCVR